MCYAFENWMMFSENSLNNKLKELIEPSSSFKSIFSICKVSLKITFSPVSSKTKAPCTISLFF